MEYLDALERVVAYIENHLDDDISAADAAREAGYSYYHLTRIFQSVLGENIGNYIQKRRLSRAASELLRGDRKIIDVALDNGFESPEVFSRAFRKVYRMTPSAYRRGRQELFLGNKKRLDRELLNHVTSRMTVQPDIIYIEETIVAGIRGSAAVDNVYSLWQQFAAVEGRIRNRHPSGRVFGICEKSLQAASYDMPFTEVIGAQVCSPEPPGDGLVLKTIPAGKYAVFTHHGPLSGLLKTYEYIWGTWVFATPERLDDREDFELYDERFRGRADPDSEMDIYIPII